MCYEGEHVSGTPDENTRSFHNPVSKEYVTFLETCAESGGAHTLASLEVGPGGGPNLHYHQTYTEDFEVLKGELQVWVGEHMHSLQAGDKVHVPTNTPHRFYNATGEPARFLVKLRPGHAGFEKMMQIAFGLARDGRTRSDGIPKSLYDLAIIGDLGEIRVPGMLAHVEPLLLLLAKRARRKGIDQKLVNRYCG
jgi:mannose-6-phosphate isomerase-like protein (cupin superfamily)